MKILPLWTLATVLWKTRMIVSCHLYWGEGHMKAWKIKAIEAGHMSKKPEKPTPQQVIRQAGYAEGFFEAANQVGLRVDDAKVKGDHVRIKFVGTEGNGYSRTESFPVVNGKPVRQDDILVALHRAANVIAQQNLATRGKARHRSAPQAAKDKLG